MSAQFITLDSIVTDYMDQSEQSIHKYFKLWNLAVRGMDKLGIDFFYQIKSLKIPVNANKTANLPVDYMNWSKVGVLNNRGEVIPLKYNDKLTLYASQSPTRKTQTEDNTLFNWYIWNSNIFYNYWTGSGFMTLYGIPSGAPFVGSFKIDANQKVILLDENFCYDYIIVEYQSSPNPDVQYQVPIQFREALIAWLGWQDIYFLPSSRKGNLGDKASRKNNYYNERRNAWLVYKPVSLQEAYEWSLANQRLTVKG